jgi:hypothetical protein
MLFAKETLEQRSDMLTSHELIPLSRFQTDCSVDDPLSSGDHRRDRKTITGALRTPAQVVAADADGVQRLLVGSGVGAPGEALCSLTREGRANIHRLEAIF